MGIVAGQRVRIAPGTYRVGRTPNSHIIVGDDATGIVRVVYEHSEQRRDATLVLVYLDEAAAGIRQDPTAPRSAMVPPDKLAAL